jgi:hypothetical protein
VSATRESGANTGWAARSSFTRERSRPWLETSRPRLGTNRGWCLNPGQSTANSSNPGRSPPSSRGPAYRLTMRFSERRDAWLRRESLYPTELSGLVSVYGSSEPFPAHDSVAFWRARAAFNGHKPATRGVNGGVRTPKDPRPDARLRRHRATASLGVALSAELGPGRQGGTLACRPTRYSRRPRARPSEALAFGTNLGVQSAAEIEGRLLPFDETEHLVPRATISRRCRRRMWRS